MVFLLLRLVGAEGFGGPSTRIAQPKYTNTGLKLPVRSLNFELQEQRAGMEAWNKAQFADGNRTHQNLKKSDFWKKLPHSVYMPVTKDQMRNFGQWNLPYTYQLSMKLFPGRTANKITTCGFQKMADHVQNSIATITRLHGWVWRRRPSKSSSGGG